MYNEDLLIQVYVCFTTTTIKKKNSQLKKKWQNKIQKEGSWALCEYGFKYTS